MLPILCALLYVFRYRNNNNPPLYDIISPCVTLTICWTVFSSYKITAAAVILCCGLLVDAVADLLMHNYPLPHCLIIFSFGHLVKQLVALMTITQIITWRFGIVTVVYFITVILLIVLTSIRNKQLLAISCYSSILACTVLSLSLAHNSLDYGYLFYITSDLLIGYELAFHKIYPRFVRVLGVPMLYWLSQYLTMHHLLQ